MWLYNNTSYANNTNYGFTTAYGTNTIQNCLSYKSQKNDSYKAQNVVAIDHNSWNGFTMKDADFLSLDTTVILAPRNSNSELPESPFLHLAEGSDLIDAGIDCQAQGARQRTQEGQAAQGAVEDAFAPRLYEGNLVALEADDAYLVGIQLLGTIGGLNNSFILVVIGLGCGRHHECQQCQKQDA